MLNQNKDTQPLPGLSQKSHAILVESLDLLVEDTSGNDKNIKIYEKIIKELLPWLETEKNPFLWTQKIFAQQFISPTGKILLGVEILTGLSIAIFQSENDISNYEFEAIIDDGEYGINNCVYKLLNSLAIAEIVPPVMPEPDFYDIEQSIQKDFSLTDNGQSAKDKIKFIEEILDQIVKRQFSGNLLAITTNNAEVIKKSSYGQGKESSITGMMLLEEYCCALECLRHLDSEQLKRKSILGNKKNKELLITQALEDYQITKLRTLAGINSGLKIQLDSLDCINASEDQLESALIDVLSELPVSLREKIDLILAETMIETAHGLVTLKKLAEHFQLARYNSQNSSEEAKSLFEIRNINGFTARQAIEYILIKHKLIDSSFPAQFSEFTAEDINKFSDLHGISEPLAIMGKDDIDALAGVLATLKGEVFKTRSLSEFIQCYVGLEVTSLQAAQDWCILGNKRLRIENKTVRALLWYLANNTEDQLDIQKITRIKQHFKKSLRKEASINLEKVLNELEADAEILVEYAKDNKAESKKYLILSQLYFSAKQDLIMDGNFDIPFTKTNPFFHQREAARFLSDRSAAILADDTGLGKTYEAAAAALSLLKTKYITQYPDEEVTPKTLATSGKVLWITQASNLDSVREELLKHYDISPEQIVIVNSARGARKRADAIRGIDDKLFIITNYDTLVALKSHKKDNRKHFAKLTNNITVTIVDESQVIENPKAQRTTAISSIKSEHIWYLSATPYQNRVEKLAGIISRLDPKNFNEEVLSGLMKDTNGLRQLHVLTLPLILRRSKLSLIDHFQDPKIIPFEEQLKDGRPRVPIFERLDKSTCSYQLSSEQHSTIAWMVSNFRDWAADYNQRRGPNETKINLATLGPLIKFDWIHKTIFQPELIGLTTPEGMLESVDTFLNDRIINKGEKVIVWGWNTAVIHRIVKRFNSEAFPFGAVKIDGTTSLGDRKIAREKFQYDDDCKVIICNYKSGGVGLTLNAATTALVVQPPYTYPATYQLENRAHRVVGLKDLRFAKHKVYSAYLTPTFDPKFIENHGDKWIREVFSNGTIVEQTINRLDGGKQLYILATEGHLLGEYDIEKTLKNSLIKGLGLLQDLFDDHPKLQPKSGNALIDSAKAFLPIYKSIGDNRELHLALEELIKQCEGKPQFTNQISTALTANQELISIERLNLYTQVLRLKNQWIKNILLNIAIDLELSDNDDSEISRQELVAGIYIPHVSRALNDSKLQFIPNAIGEYFKNAKDNPITRWELERALISVCYLANNSETINWLNKNLSALNEKEPKKVLKALYQLACINKLAPELLSNIQNINIYNEHLWDKVIDITAEKALEIFCSADHGSVSKLKRINTLWTDESITQLLGLAANQANSENTQSIEQSKEVLKALLDNKIGAKRISGDWINGNSIDFIAQDADFWAGFNEDVVIKQEKVNINADTYKSELLREYSTVRKRLLTLYAGLISSEGKMVDAYINGSKPETITELQNNHQNHQKLQQLFNELLEVVRSNNYEFKEEWIGRVNGIDRSLIKRNTRDIQKAPTDREKIIRFLSSIILKLENREALNEKSAKQYAKIKEELTNIPAENLTAWLKEKQRELQRLVAWQQLDLHFEYLKHDIDLFDYNRASQILGRKQKYYAGDSFSALTDELSRVTLSLQAYNARINQPDQIVITLEETSDPYYMLRMGELDAGMLNCFASTRNAADSLWSIGAAASKNVKLLIAKDDRGQIVACAALKVRKSQDNKPVLFLERGIGLGAYTFTREFQLLVDLKRQLLEQKGYECIAASQVQDDHTKSDDIIVSGTGAYTKNEYAEAVFGLRNPDTVQHSARPISSNKKSPHKRSELLYLSAPNIYKKREVADFVEKIINSGSTLVVDIRKYTSKEDELVTLAKIVNDCSARYIKLSLDSLDTEDQEQILIGSPQENSSREDKLKAELSRRYLMSYSQRFNEHEFIIVLTDQNNRDKPKLSHLLKASSFDSEDHIEDSAAITG